MDKKNLLENSFILSKDSSIEEAMGAITDNQRGTVIIVDDKCILRGIISDGDIRRAMLKGATLLAPISKFVNMNPVVLSQEELNEKKYVYIFEKENSINVLPVIDSSNVVVDVVVRDPGKRKEL